VVKAVTVEFKTGQEVLAAYWGYLADGGLVIPAPPEVGEGESVALRIRIASLATDYAIAGRVVKRHPEGRQAVVAFHPGEPHDMLLSAVLAETDDVPPREHRRFACNLAAEVVPPWAPDQTVHGRIVNVSEVGCCVQLSGDEAEALPLGTSDIRIHSGKFRAVGRVVWARAAERGVQFVADAEPDDDAQSVRELIESL
jgi:hypothetical protein